MYIPSHQITKLISSEKYGIWAEPFEGGNEAALIIKAPSSTIKAVAQGCRIKFFAGVTKHRNSNSIYITIAVNIYDSVDTPILIPMTSRYEIEKRGISALLKHNNFVLAFFDEMDFNVCSATGTFGNDFCFEKVEKLCSIDSMSLVDSFELANDVIDSFCYSIDPNYGTSKKHDSEFFSCDIIVSDIKTQICVSIDKESNVINYKIDGNDEGLTQENQLKHAIDLSFKGIAFHSPKVKIGKKYRELTDVLVTNEEHFYLIESKAACVNVSGFGKTMDRKQAGVIKNSYKALKQLEGAIKAIARKEKITSNSGENISVPEGVILHGIVIVSDFSPTKQWNNIVKKIYQIHSDTQSMIHIMDLNEFIYILKLSQNPQINLNVAMHMRFMGFYNSGNLNIQSMDSSLQFSPPHEQLTSGST